jgi:aminoglycoside phosphotransferase (APT) family kinase protein
MAGTWLPELTALIDVLPAHRFDEDRLRGYLATRMAGVERMTVRQFQGGQSNPTFLLEGAAEKWVLRKKPPGLLLPSAHQVEREFRIINALHGSTIPVPRAVLLCEDASVIGTPFYVMEFISGRVFDRPDLEALTVEERPAAYDSLNETLAALHQIDWSSMGLGDFGRSQNYLTRQVERWSRQYKASIVGEGDALMADVSRWLQDNMPDEGATTIVHGDFRIGNMLYAPDFPQVAAVLDWELSTLGDPISDLAYCCLPYHLPAGLAGVRGLKGLDLIALGIPTEEVFLAAYCRRTGRQSIAGWSFYVAFSLFRLTAILQGVFARAVQGNASSADAFNVGSRIKMLARAAHSVAYGAYV